MSWKCSSEALKSKAEHKSLYAIYIFVRLREVVSGLTQKRTNPHFNLKNIEEYWYFKHELWQDILVSTLSRKRTVCIMNKYKDCILCSIIQWVMVIWSIIYGIVAWRQYSGPLLIEYVSGVISPFWALYSSYRVETFTAKRNLLKLCSIRHPPKQTSALTFSMSYSRQDLFKPSH